MIVPCLSSVSKDTSAITGVYKRCYTYTGMTDENYGRRMELKVYKLFHVEYITFNFSYRASIPIICYSHNLYQHLCREC